MKFGNKRSQCSYTLNEEVIEEVQSFKDLGITISSPLNFSTHISGICSTANRRLGALKKSFISRDPQLMTLLYKAHVRPVLEFGCIQWSPYKKYAIDDLEKVQKRFCRLFPSLHELRYKDKLQQLGLLSLRARRLRYQLIFLFKIVNGLIPVGVEDLFSPSRRSLRGNVKRLFKPYSRTDLRRKFFAIEVIDHWNNLTATEVNANSINAFKNSINSYFCRHDIW